MPQRQEAVLLALAVIVALAGIDLAMGPGLQVTGLLAVAPFLTAMFVSARRTAMVGLIAVLVNFALAFHEGLEADDGQIARLVGVVLAAIAAVVLTKVRVREQQRALSIAHIAEVAQLAVLRTIPPLVGPSRVSVRYVSASVGARVGGDFYEALRVEGGMRAIVGDVRGKGLGSVQLANVLIGAFRGADHDKLELDAVARGMDSAFVRFEPSEEDFATAVLVELTDDGTLLVANCGHPPPLLVSWGRVSELSAQRSTLPLGLGSDPVVTPFSMEHGDRLLLFTDGITEARFGTTPFDLLRNSNDLGQGTTEAALDAMVESLRTFLRASIKDDVALMLVERR